VAKSDYTHKGNISNYGELPNHEQYGLTNQIRRAAVSVPSNIAEGQARGQAKEFARFLRISLGSWADIETQLVIAAELKYINREQLNSTSPNLDEIRKMLFGLIGRISASCPDN
jgi:four helix bundle protein